MKNKSFEHQLELLWESDMQVSITDKEVQSLSSVGYYKLKEFAEPLATIKRTINSSGKRIERVSYTGIKYEWVISRYYQDKNLRMIILSTIEDIEQALKVQVSYYLGENLGYFGYLSFKKWANNEKYGKYYISSQEKFIKNTIRKNFKNLPATNDRLKKNNFEKGLPSVWLGIDSLTFGQCIKVLKLMKYTYISKIARYFNCNEKELISWLDCIHLVRNVCAHNGNFIDFKLRTTPVLNDQMKKMLYFNEEANKYSDRMAVVIIIMVHLIKSVNPKYNCGKIIKALKNLTGRNEEKLSHYYGFSNFQSINLLNNLYLNG